jgi:periplasmic protein TonB
MTSLWLQNLLSYSLQIAAIALAGALLLRLLRIRLPQVRLFCWQALLALCILLPAVQPWRPASRGVSAITVSTGMMAPAASGPHAQPAWFSLSQSMLLILGAGVAIRFALLGIGFWRLRRYRRRSRLMAGAFDSLQRRMLSFAEVRISGDVSGPVTFGFLTPVILLPEDCLENESIACHELVHVRRRDWLFTVLEECLLSVLWFHPAMWWLVAEIQLAREEAVDREVVGLLNSREQYLESLLALAASQSGLDLVPASPFLRKRHLKKRVASLMKEVSMSRFRLNSSLAAFVAALGMIGWISVRSFPLEAAPQDKPDAAGVTVQQGSVALLHRVPVRYPAEALAKNIQGTVVLEVTLSETGTVTDARVLSGPEELRAAALQSVLQWHYSNDAHASIKTQASVVFTPPVREGIGKGVSGGVGRGVGSGPGPGVVGGITGGIAAVPPPPPPPPPAVATVEHIVMNVPDELKRKLEGRVTLHEGDQLTGNAMAELYNSITAVDEHLRLNIFTPAGQKGTTVAIVIENTAPMVAAAPAKIRVGGDMQAANLIQKVTPIYPAEAKEARIQGVVHFTANISKEGKVVDLQLISGHPLLAGPARDAVMQWVYKPTLLNGNPIDVVTEINVNFTLLP